MHGRRRRLLENSGDIDSRRCLMGGVLRDGIRAEGCRFRCGSHASIRVGLSLGKRDITPGPRTLSPRSRTGEQRDKARFSRGDIRRRDGGGIQIHGFFGCNAHALLYARMTPDFWVPATGSPIQQCAKNKAVAHNCGATAHIPHPQLGNSCRTNWARFAETCDGSVEIKELSSPVIALGQLRCARAAKISSRNFCSACSRSRAWASCCRACMSCSIWQLLRAAWYFLSWISRCRLSSARA